MASKRKKIFIALGSIALIFALFIGSYVIRQNKQQEMLPISEMENNEDIIETDNLLPTDDNIMADDEGADNEVIEGIVNKEVQAVEEGDGSGMYGEPAAKLDAIYEDAMANSNLEPFEKEMIRLIVEKEGKTFEEALESVRPGSKVVQEGTETQTPSNNQKPGNNTKPTTPTKPTNPPKKDNTTPKKNEGESGGANFNNPDNRTEQQKKADEDALGDWGGGHDGGPGEDVSHEPDL